VKVVRNSERKSYEDAKAAHDVLLQEHRQAVKEIERANEEIKASHAEAVARRDQLQADEERQMAEQHVERVRQHEDYVEWWEETQRQKERLPKLTKRVNAWVDKLLPGHPEPGPPGDPPEPREFATLAEVPEPVYLDVPHAPEFGQPTPPVYEAKQAEKSLVVETKWGKTVAPRGAWVLKNTGTREEYVVPDEDFRRVYTKV
jgi:hypothetical protein